MSATIKYEMKTRTIIAGIILLLLPLSFSVSTITLGNGEAKTTTATSITWVWTKTTLNFFNGEQTELKAMNPEWFKENNYFDNYFGGNMWIYVVLALILTAIALAIAKDDSIIGPAILILVSILILFLRSQELANNDLGWMKTIETFQGTISYREIPFSPIVSSVIAAFDFRNK